MPSTPSLSSIPTIPEEHADADTILPPLPAFDALSLGLSGHRDPTTPTSDFSPAPTSPTPDASPEPTTPVTPIANQPATAAIPHIPDRTPLEKTPGGQLATSLLASDVWGKAANLHPSLPPSPTSSTDRDRDRSTSTFPAFPVMIGFPGTGGAATPTCTGTLPPPPPVRERLISSPRPLKPKVECVEKERVPM